MQELVLRVQVSEKMDPNQLVKLIDIVNPHNMPARITIIARMGAENMRVKLPHLIRGVRGAGQIVTWVSDPMHGNTIKAPCGLNARPFDAIMSLWFMFLAQGNRNGHHRILHLQRLRVLFPMGVTSASPISTWICSLTAARTLQ